MKTQTLSYKKETAIFLLPLLNALMITLFLFYIDEGFYDFRWMLNFGNWIVFLVYVAAIYGVQLLLTLPLFRFSPQFILIVTRIILIILGLLFLVLIVFN